ncbi:sensor histidine kinase [Thermoactinospora rubra]|uniref:sensor histidine kinase n=1 Tax=Thermoactinospora rubra TaxID=1088767 RepID=UPI000A0FC540|nr:HAMP domain-containing sensor histidine kinase [Thermoactinospora rubra]
MTIRARFAFACGAVFLILGTLLILGIYLLVRSQLEPVPGWRNPEYVRIDGWQFWPGEAGYEVANMRGIQIRRLYQQHTLEAVRNVGVLAVAAGTALAAFLGWRFSHLVFRPLQDVTVTARRVAQAYDLSERIDYRGPSDELKELADTFDTLLARLARVFEGQRRFVANASHELRTPLAINRTLVDVAVRRPDAGEDLKRLGESLLVVNERHERLINGLLALAEGEQAMLDRRDFDLSDVVEHALDQAAGEAEERKVTQHRLLDAAPVQGDPVLLERLVQNLVENGIRHNELGGELWVTTRQREDRVELVVANTGLPVQPYEVETIFQPFRRLHGDRLNSDRGTGLGMSIVKTIADAHGGTVSARPREEGGLIVTVELPLQA